MGCKSKRVNRGGLTEGKSFEGGAGAVQTGGSRQKKQAFKGKIQEFKSSQSNNPSTKRGSNVPQQQNSKQKQGIQPINVDLVEDCEQRPATECEYSKNKLDGAADQPEPSSSQQASVNIINDENENNSLKINSNSLQVSARIQGFNNNNNRNATTERDQALFARSKQAIQDNYMSPMFSNSVTYLSVDGKAPEASPCANSNTEALPASL